jgi:hypothetical protein
MPYALISYIVRNTNLYIYKFYTWMNEYSRSQSYGERGMCFGVERLFSHVAVEF